MTYRKSSENFTRQLHNGKADRFAFCAAPGQSGAAASGGVPCALPKP